MEAWDWRNVIVPRAPRKLPLPEDRPSASASAPGQQRLELTVLFTNVPDTLRALRHATGLAFDLDACIHILVLQVVPYPLPIDRPPVEPEFRLRQLHALWNQERIETAIKILLCRDALYCLSEQLPPNSLVVIGDRTTWWPFSREKRIARRLRRRGHQVLLVAESRSQLASAVSQQSFS